MKYVALLGEFTLTSKTHRATNAATQHSCDTLGIGVAGEWVSTEDIAPSLFARYSGIWVAPGSPYKNMDRALWAIQHARENRIPCLGTCGGFQHMIIEYARNALGFQDAQHAEYDPYASNLFISRLECSLVGRAMKLNFGADSHVAAFYGARSAIEEYYCNFGVNPDKMQFLTSGSLRVTGSDSEGAVRVIELPDHPFFLGTLFVPQARSTPEKPHPLVTAFLKAVAGTD
ncbi:MAG: CTP synthase [Chloroflexi bacterium]|nr:CTP synthase [Chloroflexota bacterium]